MIVKRDILKKLKKAARSFGVVSITGPRQSGKTTLAKYAFPKHDYVNLEDPITLSKIKDDPKAFISSVRKGVIIDEIQRFPELLSYIQVSIDEKYKAGKFILTGSQNLLLSNKISQSLAGRVAVLTLLPFSLNEVLTNKLRKPNVDSLILNGFYPGKLVRRISRALYYASYLETYIERDVRTLRNIGDLSNFKRFLSILAGRIGQILNLTSIANDIGVTHKTIAAWISILEASYIIFRLPPYYKNFGKRLIKSPKIYFYDTGLASFLLEIDSIKELKNHFARGQLFENFIIADFLKAKYNMLSSSNLYFWRDKTGHEIDLLISTGVKTLLMEIKSNASYHSEYLKNIEFYRSVSDEKTDAFVVYKGNSIGSVKQTQIINWQEILNVQKQFL